MAAKWVPRFTQGVDFYEWMAGSGWDTLSQRLHGVAPADESDRTWLAGENEDDSFDGVLGNARLAADEVARRVPVSRSPRRLLDVGGGHGVYAARFCHRHPGLRATVLDTAPVLDRAGKVLADEGVADRVERRAGDFWTDELGSGYDIVLLCNLLNAYPDDRKRELLSRAAAALAPGGRLVVHDQMRRAASAGTARAIVEPTNLRLFDPSWVGTYAMPELRAWLSEVGLQIVRAGPLMSVPWTALVIGGRSKQEGAR
jgi:SAM-dependent methyltransferase